MPSAAERVRRARSVERFNPDQMRAPKGVSIGGRFISPSGGGDGGKSAVKVSAPATKKTAAERMTRARRQPARQAEPHRLPAYLPAVALVDLAEHRSAIYRGRRPNRREMLDAIDAEFHRREVSAGEMAHAAGSYDLSVRKPFDDLSAVDDSPEARRIDELVARGVGYRDAYADAHDLNPGELVRQELASNIDAQRAPGETREKAARRLYDEMTYLSYLQAEAHTNGHMLNRAALAENARRNRRGEAPISPLDLFSGPRSRARKYASEELLRFWETQDTRETYTEFRARVLGRATDKRAADRVRAGADSSRDFGL